MLHLKLLLLIGIWAAAQLSPRLVAPLVVRKTDPVAEQQARANQRDKLLAELEQVMAERERLKVEIKRLEAELQTLQPIQLQPRGAPAPLKIKRPSPPQIDELPALGPFADRKRMPMSAVGPS